MFFSRDNLQSRSTHEANKREAYDGMRAYHQSELAHKKDAVDILKTILTTSVVIFGGLVGFVMSARINATIVIVAAWTIAVLISLAVGVIVFFTNKKIDEDNRRYRKYRDEYIKERELIGLEDDLKKAGYISAYVEAGCPEKTGYHHTKNILKSFGCIVIVVAIVGVVFVYGALSASNNTAQSAPPPASSAH